jgi:hypothetical protein
MTNLVNSIKDLGVSLEALYNGDKQINLHLSDKPYVFSVILKDRRGVDCKLSSFGANLWTRTNKGVNSEKYASLSSLQRAIKNEIKNKVETDGEIKFSLSDEVYTF